MDLRITGKVTKLLDEQSGEGRKGTWRKQEFILQTEGDYPKDVCIVQWGDNIDQWKLQPGERITAHIDVQSREFNGKWYTDVKAWRVERDQGEGQSQGGGRNQSGGRAQGGEHGGAPQPAGPGANFPEYSDSSDFDDDLPF